MFTPKEHKHEYSFHGDDTLHDQTPEVQGILASLPSGAAAVGQLLVNGTGQDGKRAMVAKLPLNHPLSKAFLAKGVKHYWGSMMHPPLSYRGDAFQYRSADGADNNILHPQLGKAGLPYAKSVPGKTGIHGARPDPGDLFDLLMARKDDTESASGISSMLLYHATIIIHDIFRTNADDKNISDTSSYLDLSPLYGCDQATQNSIREKKLGLLKPDTFAEKRLLLQPPGVCIYLVMYNRFHNYIAEQLLEINENGKFSLPYLETSKEWNDLSSTQQEAMKAKQDEDLFQTARLITCGLYINISIQDYLRVLMGFHAKDTAWTLDPRVEIPGDNDKTGIQRGVGNQVSVEFNLLYRFHSALSKRDKVWSEEFFKNFLKMRIAKMNEGLPEEQKLVLTDDQIVEGETPVKVFKDIIDSGNQKGKTKAEKEEALTSDFKAPCVPAGLEPIGPGKFKFERDPTTHRFNDAQLVAEMVQVMEDPICRFGAQNVPKIFKAIEILGILQARKWEVATLNEFREFFGLPKHQHFEDINADSGVTDALRDLYDDPDMVELYPGLLCEGKGRCLDPGTLGPNDVTTALWGGVFCDAVTLVRSDRFYTVDWNVGSLTSFGMREVSSDQNVLKGSVFHRLFQRAFPGYFNYNSIHLWQPFYTPAMNIVLAGQQKYLSSLDLTDLEFREDLKLGGPQDSNFYAALAKKSYEDLKGDSKGKKVKRTLVKTSSIVAVFDPVPDTKISNYNDIRNRVLGKNKTDFQNPSVLDKEMIPGKTLQDMLTGNSDTWDGTVSVLKDLVTEDVQEMFLKYFIGMSKEITEREKRKFQTLRLTPAFFNEERRKLKFLDLPPALLKEKLDELNLAESVTNGQSTTSAKERLKRQKAFEAVSARAQVYQLDVVKDYTIPVITRFVADFLGFWDSVKTPANTQRKYNENQIYQHIHNCQAYLAYCSDETTIWKRRVAFKASIQFLKERSEYGVQQAQEGVFGTWFSRNLRTDGDQDYVVKLREFGVTAIRALIKRLGNTEKVAAMMLAIVLDAAHKSVMTFTEVLAYFVDHPHEDKPDVSEWVRVQNLAYETLNPKQTFENLKRYVLEAQRLRVDLPLVRVYKPEAENVTFSIQLNNGDGGSRPEQHTLRKGDRIILQLRDAQQDPKIFPDPQALSLDPRKRDLKNYLIYGHDNNNTFDVKQLTLLGLTGMFKYIATLKDLRVAHDKLGRVKRAKTPASVGAVESYMTVQWDQLVPFPTTWSLRFNGEGRGVYDGRDNADQGHGSNVVYQKPTAIPGGGSFASGSSESGLSPATLPAALEHTNGVVKGMNGFLKGTNGAAKVANGSAW